MTGLPLLLLCLASVCLLVVTLFVVLGVFTQPALPPVSDYEVQEFLLSPAELELFNVLLLSVSPKQYVFAKVRIGDLVRVAYLPTDSAEWWKKFGPIAKKHVDFVITSRSPVRPQVVVELDDSTHSTQSRRERDSLVDRVFTAAGLPILHIPYSSHGYQVPEIRRQLTALLHPGPG